jgi:hypothetical protein
MAATSPDAQASAAPDASLSVPVHGAVQMVVLDLLVRPGRQVLQDAAESFGLRHLHLRRQTADESVGLDVVHEFGCQAWFRAQVRDCRSASSDADWTAQQVGRSAPREPLLRDALQKVEFPAFDRGAVAALRMVAVPAPVAAVYQPASLPPVRARLACLEAQSGESELQPAPSEQAPRDAAEQAARPRQA